MNKVGMNLAKRDQRPGAAFPDGAELPQKCLPGFVSTAARASCRVNPRFRLRLP